MAAQPPPHLRGRTNFPAVGNMHTADQGIDRRGATRVVPMKVLCLGCSRTGTASLRNALKRLGYIDAYHGFSVISENPLDGRIWLEAQCPRVGKTTGRKFGVEDFDQVLGHCQATLDFPSVCFSEELMDAYPEAKVILSIRDEDSWVKSMNEYLYHSLHTSGWRLDTILANTFRTNWRFAPRIMDTFVTGFYGTDLETEGRATFREQNDLVRRKCADSPGRLLEWRVQDGWEPLCEFLGEKVPDVEFPRGNDTAAYKERLRTQHNAVMGRDWKAAKVLFVLDHWFASACVLGAIGLGVYHRRSLRF